MKQIIFWASVLTCLTATCVSGATQRINVQISAGKHHRLNAPVRKLLTVPDWMAEARSVIFQDPKGRVIVGQLTAPGLTCEPAEASEGKVPRELHLVLPELKANEVVTLQGTIPQTPPPDLPTFRWHDKPGESAELRFDSRPVLRYMYKPLDDSTNQARELTYKVYHHLFDPSGKRLVTKGPGGKYTHHRGLFYGFNRVTYGDGKKADVWHCTGDAHQSHVRFLSSEAGPVLGRHRLLITWHGVAKEVFAREEREMTVYNVAGGLLVEFTSRVRSADGTVKLDGDPQHAGFHFRADNEVADKTENQTYFLRPDGRGKPGETRNWPGHKTHVNLPWDAMSFVLGGKRYTVAYLDKPTNPKEARFSERAYGRFGSYFEYELDSSRTLDVNYRVWLQEGEMTGEEVAARSADFVEPATVTGWSCTLVRPKP